MRLTSIFCLMFCACASTVSVTPNIENRASIENTPTLERNLAATVSVFYTYNSSSSGEVVHEQVVGVVIDTMYVLATPSSDGFRNQTDVRITAYIPNTDSVAPSDAFRAKMIKNTSYVAILEVSEPLLIQPIIFAVNGSPRAGEYVYALGNTYKEQLLLARFGIIIKPIKPTTRWWYSYSNYSQHADDLILKFYKYGDSAPSGVFNKQHEFVGFLTKWTTSVEAGGARWPNYGYFVTTPKTLAPFLQQA